MQLFSHQLKKSWFFLGKPLAFFITVSSDVFIFFFHAFISSCFYFLRCFRVFSLLITFFHFTVSSLFVRYFVFVLLYRKCYGFERAFFTLRRFLPYTPSQHLVQRAFIKASQRPAVQP